ncbi:hypothetical protein GCM10009116_04900 [Brevundimonas basaltis]|uniref:Uncharacterized protein (TIGR02588 family) n=1 Tax=Brevundimonas basaltis TaxID=472166 RepID=A0A7W8HZF9_9CAUL|nr:hypothetical protein [Brevundimonas basaltis]MBB5292759.1 uncharacterized protein (TIGR02588 family) [Brevundimonas basaltis]
MAARRKSAPPAPALLEWAMGGLGLLLVLAALAVIVFEALRAGEPARLEARLIGTRPAGAGWLADVEVRNLGGETAAAVGIEGRLGAETAEATVDYVPAHGKHRVTLAFDADPRAARVSVAGWSEP